MKRQTFYSILTYIFIAFLHFSCKDKSDDLGAGGLGGKPEQNQFVLITNGNVLYKIAAENGSVEEVSRMEDRLVDMVGVDYADGKAFVTSEANALQAFDVNTKKELWRRPLVAYGQHVGFDATPIYKDGIVYAAAALGAVVATNAADGSEKWLNVLDPNHTSVRDYYSLNKLTIGERHILVGSDNNSSQKGADRFFFLNRHTGAEEAFISLPDKLYVVNAPGYRESLFFIPTNEKLFAFDLSANALKWDFPMPNNNYTSKPQLLDNRIFIQGSTGFDGKLWCIDADTGKEIWSNDAGTQYAGQYNPVIAEGRYVVGVKASNNRYVGDWGGRGTLFLAEASSGKIVWANEDLIITGQPVYANGRIFFIGTNLKTENNDDDGLVCVDAGTGQMTWLAALPFSSVRTGPIVVGENGVFRPGYF